MRRRSERRPGAAILLGLLLAGAAGAGAAAGAGNMADAAESAETQPAPDVAYIDLEAERIGQCADMKPASTAKGKQHKITWINTSLYRNQS